MKYGYFDDALREYIITTPFTPTKWINYIGSLEFGGFVDNLGGGVICKGDPALNRITKYLPQLPNSSFNGETAYIKVHTTNETFTFSPYVAPTYHDFDHYECHVGLGYNTYVSSYKNIDVKVTVFVPLNKPVEIRQMTIDIHRADVLKLEVIPVVEYTHFDALKQFTNADWVPQTMISEVDDFDGNILKQYAFMNKETAINYFTSNVQVDSYETDRKNFLRDHLGGDWKSPLSLNDDQLSNYQAKRGDNIAALRHVFYPKSGESINLITQLGQVDSLDKHRDMISYFRSDRHVTKALEDLKAFWQTYLSVLQVKTPDDSFNSMINIHNPKQCFTTKHWSRYLSQIGRASCRERVYAPV